jgi:hypothetical protein
MKKLIDQALAAAKANPFRAWVLLFCVAVFALGYAVGGQLGWQLYQFTH